MLKRHAFLLILCMFAWYVPTVKSDTVIWNETFDSGLPTAAGAVESNQTLSSGVWKIKGVYAKSDNGSTRACMSSAGAYLITPSVNKPTSLTFNHRASGNYKELIVEKSLDNGTTWLPVGKASAGSSSSYGTASMSVNEPGTNNVLIRFSCASATIYLDNINLSYSETVIAPPTPEVKGIHCSVASIGFGPVLVNTTSTRSFNLTASDLQPISDSLTLTCSGPFLIALNMTTGYSQILKLPYTNSKLDSTVVYVQFSPTTLTTNSAPLQLSGGGELAQLALTGTGSTSSAKIYFISPTGNDANEGSFENPWFNLQKAVDAAVAGDSIVCRGGIYYPTMKKSGGETTVRLATSGTVSKRISIVAYSGEFPVFNFKHQPKKLGIRGMTITGDYWYIRGIHITEAGDNAIKLEGNHNLIERCTFSYNDDTGLQLGFGHDFSEAGFGSNNDGSHCAYNDIVDCDSYLNCDGDNFGSDADGFACKMHNGLMNRFIRCRAWDNADDAWDLYETDYPVYIIECWAWGSGRAENFTWVDNTGSFQGNGNGVKLGGNGTGGSSKGKHEVYNSVAFNCNKTGSVKGFDQNSHTDGVKLVNCLAFGCGYDFMFEKKSNDCEYYNNVCFGNIEIAAGSINSNNAMLSSTTEAWTNTVRGFTYNDYVSLSEADAKAARGVDGSLPTRFARLKNNSVLIDKGLNKEVPFSSEFPFIKQVPYGAARDLGPYELQDGAPTGVQMLMNRSAGFSLSFSHLSETIHFSTGFAGNAIVQVFGLNGRLVAKAWNGRVESGAEYDVPFSASLLEPGMYVCKLSCGPQSKTCKLLVVR